MRPRCRRRRCSSTTDRRTLAITVTLIDPRAITDAERDARRARALARGRERTAGLREHPGRLAAIAADAGISEWRENAIRWLLAHRRRARARRPSRRSRRSGSAADAALAGMGRRRDDARRLPLPAHSPGTARGRNTPDARRPASSRASSPTSCCDRPRRWRRAGCPRCCCATSPRSPCRTSSIARRPGLFRRLAAGGVRGARSRRRSLRRLRRGADRGRPARAGAEEIATNDSPRPRSSSLRRSRHSRSCAPRGRRRPRRITSPADGTYVMGAGPPRARLRAAERAADQCPNVRWFADGTPGLHRRSTPPFACEWDAGDKVGRARDPRRRHAARRRAARCQRARPRPSSTRKRSTSTSCRSPRSSPTRDGRFVTGLDGRATSRSTTTTSRSGSRTSPPRTSRWSWSPRST